MRVWKKGIIISLILIFIVQIFSPVVNAGLEPVTDEDQEAAIRDLTENKLGGASSSAVPSSGTPSASAGSSGNTTGGTLGSVTEEDQEAAIRDLTENKLNGMSSVQDQASKLVSATTNGVSKLGDTALSWGLGILYLPFQYIIGIVTTILESVVETVSGKENITPGDILFNNVQLVDINFFSQDGSASQVVQTIRANVAGWYYGIRTIAIIALLSVLIYIAIRMIISTTGEEKGRY